MLVIRYEDAHGFGPYTNANLGFRLSHANRPLPVDEGLGLISSATRSGFTSLDQLNRWFSARDQRRMEDLGFLRVEYEVPHTEVVYSNNQALFATANAVVVSSEHDED